MATPPPSDQEYISASAAPLLRLGQTPISVPGLTPLIGPNGLLVYLSVDSDGFYAAAYEDSSGNIIIAYEASLPGLATVYSRSSGLADAALLEQHTPQALADATAFANTVLQDAQALGINQSQVYVTGWSLGGAEAEAAAQRYDLSGVTFGAPGIPGYVSNGAQPNLINFVAYGDPVANFASDTTGEVGFAPSTGMAHVGSVQPAGNPSDGNLLSAYSELYAQGSWYNKWALASDGLFDDLSNHDLENYAAILNVTVPQGFDTAPGPYDILFGLDEPLGASGMADFDEATLLNSGTLVSNNFSIEIGVSGTTCTIIQKQSIDNSSWLFSSDAGTLTANLTPTSNDTYTATFDDSTNGDIDQLTFSSLTGGLEAEITNMPNGTSEVANFDYTDAGSWLYVANTYSGLNGSGTLVNTDTTDDSGTSQVTTYTPGDSSIEIFYTKADGTGTPTSSEIIVADGDSVTAAVNTPNETATFSGNGTLIIADPISFTGTISSFLPGDTIDLTGISASSVALESTSLVVQETNGVTLSLQLGQGVAVGDAFTTSPDGNGGTDITVAPAYSFTQINIPGSFYTSAWAINNSGMIVGYYQTLNSFSYGFIDSGGVFTSITPPGGRTVVLSGINNAGQAVGGYAGISFILTNGTITTVNVQGSADPVPTSINDSGQIVGYGITGSDGEIFINDYYSFLYSGGVTTYISMAGSGLTKANGINDAGEVVGTYTVGSDFEGFIYNQGVYTSVNVPGARSTELYGINDLGEIVGTYSGQSGSSVFVMNGSSITTVDVPDDGSIATLGINDAGDIVFSETTSNDSEISFLGTPVSGQPVSCFAAGTRITMARGPCPVEDLGVGDLLPTHFGGLSAITWVGRRRIDCSRHPVPRNVWPVRVRAGAFGEGLPCRDLWLSPDHAVYANNALIPVKYLINDMTIEQVPMDEVIYYHIELAQHDVLLAEGLPAESYLDTGDRSKFANGGGAIALHPDFSTRLWEAMGCAPLVVTGPAVTAVRTRLLQRAAQLAVETDRQRSAPRKFRAA